MKPFSKHALRQCVAIATKTDLEKAAQDDAQRELNRELQEGRDRVTRRQTALLNECLVARNSGNHYIVISSRWELGSTYDEVMDNLALLEQHQVYLRIIPQI